ncbi:MAG: T9SS type A sorting domain-containing protein [Crocinitomicaceae bacterium]|nr:T9SS type A sorting domain-containing protein [Crocinitomicaceae bacterium]
MKVLFKKLNLKNRLRTISLTLLLVNLCFSYNAQVFDLTTGQGSLGSTDPVWTAKISGSVYLPTYIIFPVSADLDEGTSALFGVENECGRWISKIQPNSSHYLEWSYSTASPTSLTYTYMRHFTINECLFDPVAHLNLDFLAATSSVMEVKVNGVVVYSAAYGTVTGFTPTSLIVDANVHYGLNSVQVVVKGNCCYSALIVCGEITVDSIDEGTPSNLGCCDPAAGEILSWTTVPGAVGYEVVVLSNDPVCYKGTEIPLPYETTYTTTENIFLMPPSTDSHAWKVRAIYPSGCYSEFSEQQCGCAAEIGCSPPVDRNCLMDNGVCLLNWSDMSGATEYEVEISYNDDACCEGEGNPTSEIFTVNTNSMSIPDIEDCFSWRIRSVCGEGNFSAWTSFECGCYVKEGKALEVEPKLFIEPNPSNDIVTIRLDDLEVTTEQKAELIIVDMSGVTVYKSDIGINEPIDVDVNSMVPGLYICRIVSEGATVVSKRLIVE